MARTYKFDPELSHAMLDQLLKWREETRPEHGNLSERQKNYKAGQALLFAGLLFEDLIGWAAHHSMGVSLLGLDLEDRKSGRADTHEAEKFGADWQSDDVSRTREALARLILILGLVPSTMRQPLGSALQALNLGEVNPLLQPTISTRWKGAHSLASLRLLVVMHVFFRWGRKTHTKRAALELVGESLGVSVGTLRTWEIKWLPDIYPDVKKGLFQLAKRAGEIQRCIDQDPDFETDDLVAASLERFLITRGHSQQQRNSFRIPLV